MSGSDRRVGVALAGLAAISVALGTGAFFGALNAPHYGYQTAHSGYRDTQAEQTNPSQIDRDRAGLPYFAERIASGPEPENTKTREQRDLAAQESMSVWAFWLLLVSAVGTATAIAGTAFLAWQIVLTRRAVSDTGKATAAMDRQTRLMEAAQRPWVSPSCELVSFNKKGRHIKLEVCVTFKNVGKTIATDFFYDSYLDPINPDLDDILSKSEKRFEFARSRRDGDNTVLMPGEEAKTKIRSSFSLREQAGKALPRAIVITAVTYYRVSPESDWSGTEVSFLLAGPDSFDMVIQPMLSDGDHDDTTVHINRHVTGKVS